MEVEQASETHLKVLIWGLCFSGRWNASLDSQCWKFQPLKMKPLCCPKTYRTIYPVRQHHILTYNSVTT